MVSAIVLIGKYNQDTYIVRAEDWLNPNVYQIDAQDPYTGDTHVILKSDYKIGWVLNENGEANYSF
jgi:CTP:phosphocholine cytidylyltransferase-like protein